MGNQNSDSVATISYYNNIKQVTDGKEIGIDLFLLGIQSGKWQDKCFAYNLGQIKKIELPYVTISGKFSRRANDGLEKHSGFIGIDVDDVSPEYIKEITLGDEFIYAIFSSVSQKGVCILFRINEEKHLESFEGIEIYLYDKYGIIADTGCKDVSRPRFVSYDADIIINKDARKFTRYAKREKKKFSPPPAVYERNDFDQMIKEIDDRGINLCESYRDWVRVGFALADQFGEGGRQYFETLSSKSTKYNPEQCRKQYNNCLKNSGTGNRVRINTLYYMAKSAGVSLYSEKTKKIIQVAQTGKKIKRSKDDIAKGLLEFEDISRLESDAIIDQVFANAGKIETDDNIIDQLESWIRQEYDIRLNEVSKQYEFEGEPMTDQIMNTIYMQARRVFDKDVNFELLERVIKSKSTESYHPIKEYIKEISGKKDYQGSIAEYCKCFTTSDDNHFLEFFHKWYVGLVGGVFGKPSPLVLVYCGAQNSGKTEAFRKLLPVKLRQYYAESKLDSGKVDDDILMCKKLLIVDDEFSGKSKYEEKRFKELTSKDSFSIREAYGRYHVDMKRMSALGGNCNDLGIITDPTGNRRIIAVEVLRIDFAAINQIDREKMFLEAVELYNGGHTSDMTSEEIMRLNKLQSKFEDYSAEYELITKYFTKPDNEVDAEAMTTTDIMAHLETNSNIKRLSLKRIGAEMKRLGYNQKNTWTNAGTRRCWIVQKNEHQVAPDPLTLGQRIAQARAPWTPPQDNEIDFGINE